jgi:hypothetical protein
MVRIRARQPIKSRSHAELAGFTQEELTNWLLADYFAVFDDEDESFINETIGSMYFKDR